MLDVVCFDRRECSNSGIESSCYSNDNVRESSPRVHFIVHSVHVRACHDEVAEHYGTLAKAVNKELARKGRVIADRYHVHVLRTPTEVRNAVHYVLRNAERHGAHDAWPECTTIPVPDPLSTAAWFPFWKEQILAISPRQVPASLVKPAESYLMAFAFQAAPLAGRTLSFAEPVRREAADRASSRERPKTASTWSTANLRAPVLNDHCT
jgi:hypothetical protein